MSIRPESEPGRFAPAIADGSAACGRHALARTQHAIAQTNSVTAVSEMRQIAGSLRDNAAHMHDLLRFACFELLLWPDRLLRLRHAFEHFDRQLPLLLASDRSVEVREGESIKQQEDQRKFLEVMDEAWEQLEDAVHAVNSDMILSETERRRPGIDCWRELDGRLQTFKKAVVRARKKVAYDVDPGRDAFSDGTPSPSLRMTMDHAAIDRHTRRMTNLSSSSSTRLRWSRATRSGNATRSSSGRRRRRGVPARGTRSLAPAERPAPLAGRDGAEAGNQGGDRAYLVMTEFVDTLRTSSMINRQGGLITFTVIFVQASDYGSMRLATQRLYGTLAGAMFAMFLLSLILDVCGLDDDACGQDESTSAAAMSTTIHLGGRPHAVGHAVRAFLSSTVGADCKMVVACFTAPIISMGHAEQHLLWPTAPSPGGGVGIFVLSRTSWPASQRAKASTTRKQRS